MNKKELKGNKKRVPKIQTQVNFEKVIDLMLSGTKNPKDEKIGSFVPMTMKQAVKEVGISEQNFIYYINTYPSLREKYEAIRVAKREIVGTIAENNIKIALEDKDEIDLLDKAKLSLDYLKATEKSYNPRIQIDQNIKSLNLDISDDEIKTRIQELMSRLG